MSSAIAFLDTETTGLDPRRHELWEIGFILRPAGVMGPAQDQEHLYRIQPTLRHAQDEALEINRYYEQTAGMRHQIQELGYYAYNLLLPSRRSFWSDRLALAGVLAESLAGRHIVGANPSFDTGFLTPFLTEHGLTPGWYYHPIDVKVLTVGYLRGRREQVEPDCRTDELAERIGITPAGADRHTALGDARQVRDMYDAVMGVAA